ncbi:hypothetical protein F4775DRAFT_367293 [Biscogniauxia sp. FL1348]|nr:hypothetical protein F4775DRAFT_367293 [Biscogniauxia sp. FL1348]
MAEAAVGFLGTAAGLVSLGMQVYGGLKKYLNDFQSRDSRIEKSLDYLEQLKNSLAIVNIAVPALSPQQQVPKDTVTSSLKSCEDELRSLQARLHKYGTVARTDFKEKIRDVKMKLQFPFQVSELSDLEYQLERIIRNLMVAINGLGLNTLADIHTTMLDVNTSSHTTKEILATLEAKVNTLRTSHDGSISRLVDIESTLVSIIDGSMSEVSGRLSNIECVANSTQVELISRLDAQSQMIADIQKMLQSQQLQSCQSNEGLRERVLTGMMVSKPALLKEMHDTISPPQRDAQLVPLSGTQIDSRDAQAVSSQQWSIPEISCNCRLRRKKTRHRSEWSPCWLFNETTIHIKHRPDCPWAILSAQERQRDFGIVFTGLRRFISTAASISLSINYGAGGYSISMAPRCFDMVDQTSPAFALVRYTTGAARSTDVDRDERTILQEVAWQSYISNDCHLNGINYLQTAIMNMGVPYESNISHSSSFHFECVFMNVHNSNSADIIAKYWEILVLHALRSMSGVNDTGSRIVFQSLLRRQILESQEATEVLGLDYHSPFARAIRHRDKDELLHALQSLQGLHMSQCGIQDQQWPFIALSCWPLGLKLILDNCPGLDHGKSRNSLLDSLLVTATTQCRTTMCLAQSKTERCSDECSCTAVTDILLKHNCPLQHWAFNTILEFGSLKLVDTILRYIKDGRERLRDLSYRYLSDAEQMRFGICDSSIPDSRAAEIVAALERKGISAYRYLKLEPYDHRLCPPHSGLESQPIFHDIYRVEHVDLAFNLGFRDVDVHYMGQTPLTKGEWLCVDSSRFRYKCWLVDHGADYTRLVVADDNPSRRTIAHYFLSTFSAHLKVYGYKVYRPHHQDRYVRQVYKLLSSLQIEDDCVCGCSAPSQGCHPLTVLLNTLIRRVGSTTTISILESICSDIQSEMPFEPVTRILTFYRLGIRHTCCNAEENRNHSTYFGDELDYIRAEDEPLLLQLEVLVTEFVEEFSRKGCTLNEFIQGTWTIRMRQIDEEERLRVLTQEERDSLRSIGVELVDESSDDSSEEMEPTTPESPEAMY